MIDSESLARARFAECPPCSGNCLQGRNCPAQPKNMGSLSRRSGFSDTVPMPDDRFFLPSDFDASRPEIVSDFDMWFVIAMRVGAWVALAVLFAI